MDERQTIIDAMSVYLTHKPLTDNLSITQQSINVTTTGSAFLTRSGYLRISRKEWPEGYFDETAGSLADDPIQRWFQGEYEEREDLL